MGFLLLFALPTSFAVTLSLVGLKSQVVSFEVSQPSQSTFLRALY
jgi:hypothetical protein